MNNQNIVFVSGHYPLTTFYSKKTRLSFEKYTTLHNYGFYYDVDVPEDTRQHILHFRRCDSIRKASILFPNAEWFIWVDSDVFVNNPQVRVETQIDLTNKNILYHLFHEAPWGCYPINTGVKFVNRKAIDIENTVWSLKDTSPWNTFPWEQKTIYEYVLPKIHGRYIIHDPYVLNCIIKAYPDKVKDALFVHMCGTTENDRNIIISNIKI